MKILYSFFLISLFFTTNICAQAVFKYEHFGKSSYRDKDNKKVKDYKGSSDVYHLGFNVPISLKVNENNRPTLWSVALGGSYASLHNQNFDILDKPLDEILNMQVGLMHLRPLKEKMSLLLSLGAGVYMADTRFSKIRGRHILGNGAGVLIWHIRPNFDLGAGLALNNTFGYPMVFPALYLNWTLDGKFKVNASLISGIDLSVGYSPSNYFELKFVVGMNGQMALLEIEDKDMVFTHQYVTFGLQPTLNINKHFSIPVTIGAQGMRSAYFKRRTMKAFFSDKDDENDPHFQISPYISAGINYNF